MRTWAAWGDRNPGFAEVGLVGREGDTNGEFGFPLTVTDIPTGWTEVRYLCNIFAHAVFSRWYR